MIENNLKTRNILDAISHRRKQLSLSLAFLTIHFEK